MNNLEPGRRINVVCEHLHRQDHSRPRLLAVLSWQVDHDLEAAVRADDSIPTQAATVLLVNERFRYKQARTTRDGRRVKLANPEALIPEPEQDAAGAMTYWRFVCSCGVDRPVRIDRLDRWMEERVAADPNRHTHTFEVTT